MSKQIYLINEIERIISQSDPEFNKFQNIKYKEMVTNKLDQKEFDFLSRLYDRLQKE